MKEKNQKKKLYTKGYWYINIYKALGSQWLLDSIRKINPSEGFIFASFSANAAYYENDVYKAIKDTYRPSFYVGDLLAEELKDAKIASHDNFYYISGQRDACLVESSMIDDHKIDVLLDCKGALWYATRLGYSSEEEMKRLLSKYKELLNPQGVLLIDYYDHHFIDSLKFQLSGNNRKQKKVQCFGEESTKRHLQRIFGDDFVQKICNEVITGDVRGSKLSDKMGTAVISVAGIDEMLKCIEEDKTIKRKFKQQRAVKHFLLNIFPKILALIIGVLVVILVLILVSGNY